MEPTQALIDDLYAEKVRRARQTPIETKLTDGPRLFAFACEAMRAGIRAQHPGSSPEQIEEILRTRLALAERLEETRHG
jgi:hypothetical protein